MVQDRAASTRDRWLTLSQACHILNVNPATLRHWADTGSVGAFRTVGGHRRFSREDIENLVGRAARAERGGSPGEGEEQALRRLRRKLRQEHGRWQETFDHEGRLRMRLLGRRLLSLVAEYLTQRKRRPQLREEARFIGREYGMELAQRGLSLREALEAFLFFRGSLNDAAQQVARGSHSADAVRGAWQEVYGLADVVLLAIAEAYEKPPSTGPKLAPNSPREQSLRHEVFPSEADVGKATANEEVQA